MRCTGAEQGCGKKQPIPVGWVALLSSAKSIGGGRDASRCRKRREDRKAQLRALMKAGADKAQTNLSISEKHEMNIEAGEINLLRTTFNTSLHLGVIKDSRNGHIGISSSDEASIEKAVSDVMDIAAGAHPDEAHDIAERQEPAEFCKGPLEPDLDAMYDRLKSFVATVGQRYPTINLRQVILSFTRPITM